MAYNPDDGTILLFGGRHNSGELLSDLWSYNPDTRTWTQLSDEGPQARMAHSLVYSPALSKVVLVGGVTDNGDRILSDTWHYDTSTGWKDTSDTAAHPKAAYHHLVYDSAEKAIILFTNGETWQYK